MTTFEELGIEPKIQRAILELGFEQPMPVQEQVIPLMLNKRNDIIAMAQTGTGKTAAFGLPLIQEAIPGTKYPHALVLCPTRELCMQIAGDLNDYALHIDNLKVLPVYGGSSIDTQITALKKGVQIIVATPGRLLDLIERRVVKLAEVTRVVLDEADEMLNMGFLDSIDAILAQVPDGRNTLLFSATMPQEIVTISKKYMSNPIEVTIGKRNAGAENIKHICYTVHARDKYLLLKRIADYNPDIYGIVFCRTRKETQEVADKLIQDGYNADSLHGDLSQPMRDMVMQKFRLRNIRLLVATDVAARGLDVDDLTHIINFQLPDDPEVYTHRSGRTGRAGKTGISIAIVNLKEKFLIRQIENKIKKTFVHAKIPTGREICEKQLFSLIDKMEKVEIDHSEIDTYLPVIFRKLEWLDKEEVIKRFVSLQFNKFLDYYRTAAEIKVPEDHGRNSQDSSDRDGRRRNRNSRDDDRGSRERSHDRGSDRSFERSFERSPEKSSDFSKMFINIGKMDGVNPRHIIDLINFNTPGKKVGIGRIDLMKTFSFFEIENSYSHEIIRLLKNKKHNDRKITVGFANEKDFGDSAPKQKRYSRDKRRER
jgi:ATP-dependent RNA helicase DeaD